ncbi:MAG: aminopeptidase [Solirubrobacteraceae bacterium]
MTKLDPEAFAALLCDWCLEVAPGQQVMVVTTTNAEPAVTALHAAILDRDAWPILRVTPPSIGAQFYRHAHDRHLDGFAPVELAEVQSVEAFVSIDAPSNTSALAGTDPALLTRAAAGRVSIRETRLRRRWASTIWPTPALAQRAGMSEADYETFVAGALFLDRPDPAAAWGALSQRQAALVTRLSAARQIRIEADGTDITLDVGGRTWMNSDGRRNMPSGEVFTGPHERSANGTIRFTVPSSRGATVSDVTLTFEDGEVVAATAEQGQEQLDAALATDAGARFLGELGIGTNVGIDRATGSTLLDEKMAGTVHLALGRSYPETGGTNVSALHWDLICDLRRRGGLSADGDPVVVDGALV